VPEDGLRFSETEVAQILWALYDSAELAGQFDALPTRAMVEDVFLMVLSRFQERGGE
jgi:hypothetical protein